MNVNKAGWINIVDDSNKKFLINIADVSYIGMCRSSELSRGFCLEITSASFTQFLNYRDEDRANICYKQLVGVLDAVLIGNLQENTDESL